MDRSNPYEAAFEAYLQNLGLCYVAVDEAKRATLGDTPIKNLDFLVLGMGGSRLLIDIKGRRFPGGTADKPRYVWENWATQDDIDGLRAWSQAFGPGYQSLFVFMYRIGPTVLLDETADLWTCRDVKYLLRAVSVDDYVTSMKVRSPKWGTVSVPSAAFRTMAKPFRWFAIDAASGTPDQEAWEHDEVANRPVSEIFSLPPAANAGGNPASGSPGRGT
ncbi:MAG: HYExAFE family protein [Gemmataceae bacterium]|nr:HYExAFE family protein [Gemmataceae bacterium]